MRGPDPFPSPCGLADPATDPDGAVRHAVRLGAHILAAWDAFLDVVESADLSLPSRLPGWTGRDACIHLGSWEGDRLLVGIVEAARTGGGAAPGDVDDRNAEAVAAHRDATDEDVRNALHQARAVIATWLDTPEPAELATARVRSAVGELPLLSLLHAGCYELAVHALDLAPCGADPPSELLLNRGLAALIDVTGALAARSAIDITVTAQTPVGGWSFTSTAQGWVTSSVSAGEFEGVGVRGSASDLLDVSAGRTSIPLLLLSRRMTVQQLTSFMRLAPLIDEVPGLPGGAALKAGVAGLGAVTGGVTKILGRLRR